MRLIWLSRSNGGDISDEFTLAICIERFRSSVEGVLPLRSVRLTRAAPSAPTRHGELLGVKVTFGCSISAGEVTRDFGDGKKSKYIRTLPEDARRGAYADSEALLYQKPFHCGARSKLDVAGQ